MNYYVKGIVGCAPWTFPLGLFSMFDSVARRERNAAIGSGI